MSKMPEKVRAQRNAIVQSFIDNLDNGGLKFVQEWALAPSPFNPLTGNVYRGCNRTNLRAIAQIRGISDPRWLTWRQIQNAGLRVKRGARSAAIEKWKRFTYERAVEGTDATETRVGLACVGYYNVFSATDVIGLPAWEPPTRRALPESEVTQVADALIASSRCPVVENDEPSAYYSIDRDTIHLPSRELFLGADATRAQHFVRTLSHEMVHSTIVPLHRTVTDRAFEELVAELGAVMLTDALGLAIILDASDANFSQHASYLRSWSRGLKDRPQSLWNAAARADAAVEYLVGRYANGGAHDTANSPN